MYTKQDGDHKTGDDFNIKGNKGIIHIVRHGETEDNASGNFRGDDAELTNKGKQQAKEVGKKLSKIEIPQIITSSLKRAIDTSHIIIEQQETNNPKDKKKFQQGGNIASFMTKKAQLQLEKETPKVTDVSQRPTKSYKRFERTMIGGMPISVGQKSRSRKRRMELGGAATAMDNRTMIPNRPSEKLRKQVTR